MIVLAAMLLCATTFKGDVRAADFKLDPPVLAMAVPAHTSAGDAPEGNTADDFSAPPSHPHFRVATGFGRDVRLDFAVRQVVPAHVRVVYDKGVDRATLVTWQGGRPWNDVIRSTVSSAGLHVALSQGVVRISN